MKRLSSGGFTIVESMIVLGVTGVMFVSLAAMVSGQQSRARFKSAMTDISTQIQSQINEVSTGYYPNVANFQCSNVSDNVVISAAAGKKLGTNSQCTFLGRAMMFGIPSTDPEEYKIHTLVGIRKIGTKEPLNLAQAGARVVAPGSTMNTHNPSRIDISTSKRLLFGTTVEWMRRADNQPVAGIAVVSSPNGQVNYGEDGALESGTVVPSIIPIPRGASSTPGVAAATGVDRIINALGLPSSSASPSDGPVRLCFRSGTTTQSGLITIGANNSTTSVELEIFGTTNCM